MIARTFNPAKANAPAFSGRGRASVYYYWIGRAETD